MYISNYQNINYYIDRAQIRAQTLNESEEFVFNQ